MENSDKGTVQTKINGNEHENFKFRTDLLKSNRHRKCKRFYSKELNLVRSGKSRFGKIKQEKYPSIRLT